MKEEWRWVKGYEGLYEVSNLGRVRSYLSFGGLVKSKPTRYLNTVVDEGQYVKVLLSKDHRCRALAVHRLVAEAFIPNPENKPTVDHIDTNPSNNRVDNLRWAARKEQMENPRTRLKHLSFLLSDENINHCKDMAKKSAKKCSKRVQCIETGEIYPSMKRAYEVVGIGLADHLSGRTKSHKKLHYKILEEEI